MIIYEVNLNIDANIFADFKSWLIEHVAEMLMFTGFIEAKILSATSSPTNENMEDNKSLTVQYIVDSLEHLDHYFNNHAKRMRQRGIDKFANKFSAERRILTVETRLTSTVKQ